MSLRTRAMPVIAMTAAATVSLAAAPAWPCPACAANASDSSTMWYALAGFVGTPFVIALVAIAVVRTLAEDRSA